MKPGAPSWHGPALVERLLVLVKLVERVESVLRDVAAGEATELRPARIDASEHADNYVAFPAYAPSLGAASVKALAGRWSGPYDTIVMAAPGVPEDGLAAAAHNLGLARRTIGDAYAPRDVEAAIREGFEAGFEA